MPQLDKYIFFSQITYLTFFFFLIYLYVRGTIVPKISTLLKYRRKKINSFKDEADSYEKILSFCGLFYDKRGRKYFSSLIDQIHNMNNSYQKESLKRITTLNDKLFSNITNNSVNASMLAKNYIELKRLNKFINNINKKEEV